MSNGWHEKYAILIEDCDERIGKVEQKLNLVLRLLFLIAGVGIGTGLLTLSDFIGAVI